MELTKPLQVDMVPLKKGKSLNPAGRPRGAKNKIPKNLVTQILNIAADLDKLGKGLQDCAEKDPRWFFENFLKPMIPKNVSLAGAEQTAPVGIAVSFVKADDNAGNL
jgi:hypothetical protein